MGKYIMYLWAPNLEEFFHTQFPLSFIWRWQYVIDAARSSGILKAKQKLGRTFDSDKLGGIAFTKISKLTTCSA